MCGICRKSAVKGKKTSKRSWAHTCFHALPIQSLQVVYFILLFSLTLSFPGRCWKIMKNKWAKSVPQLHLLARMRSFPTLFRFRLLCLGLFWKVWNECKWRFCLHQRQYIRKCKELLKDFSQLCWIISLEVFGKNCKEKGRKPDKGNFSVDSLSK